MEPQSKSPEVSPPAELSKTILLKFNTQYLQTRPHTKCTSPRIKSTHTMQLNFSHFMQYNTGPPAVHAIHMVLMPQHVIFSHFRQNPSTSSKHVHIPSSRGKIFRNRYNFCRHNFRSKSKSFYIPCKKSRNCFYHRLYVSLDLWRSW